MDIALDCGKHHSALGAIAGGWEFLLQLDEGTAHGLRRKQYLRQEYPASPNIHTTFIHGGSEGLFSNLVWF